MVNLENISLVDIIPDSITGDLQVKAIMKSIDPQLRSIARNIPNVLIYSRIDELPEEILDLLAWQWHVDFYEPTLPLISKRELVKTSIPVHRKKGTKWAVEQVLKSIGINPVIKEWYEFGGEPYTFTVEGLISRPLAEAELWGEKTYALARRAIEETKNTRSDLVSLVFVVLIDFGDIATSISAKRLEHRRVHAIWSPYPRFDIVPADVIPLDYSPVHFEKHEYRTVRTRGGIGGVSHPDNYFRFDLLPADFLPLDTVIPYIEGEFPRIMKSLGSRQHRGTVRTSATFGLSMGATDAQNSHRAYFVMPPARAETQRIDIRQARASPPEIADSTDKFLQFDAMPADMFPLDSVLPYREGHFLWR